jgi:hypothetical protein
MTKVAELRVAHMVGAPRERGRAQGEALRATIAVAMGRWKEGLGVATGCNPNTYLDGFVAATSFLPAIERWTPHLLEEVRGIGAQASRFETSTPTSSWTRSGSTGAICGARRRRWQSTAA